jgi:mono/diheme cytochrome c family protein/glucose/arabinose dehydrogenase
VLSCATAFAQQGDRKGKGEQVPRVPEEIIPAAPWLSPQEALKSFRIKDGLQIDCVAHEPLVEDPVAMTFGPDGRMWVVEMRGFMPNVDGTGEAEIPGRIVALEDTNGDGVMDKKTVFLDNLVMPRAVALARDGVLVAEPPHLWFCRDTDGDGKADEKTEVASDYGAQKSPEHTANGLVRNIDNWIYSLYHTFRYRDDGSRWTREVTPQRVQWGLDHDNFGRLFFTSNSDQLRGDVVPSHYAAGRPAGTKMPGGNVQIARDQSTWPGRINPGVNRGYERGTLRADYRLEKFTAACGTLIYGGGLLGPQFQGNAFICEPAGNFVRRDVLAERDGVITATNAYDKSEFLTSKDERFRPVNLSTGPDGALYVVDMYHGIIQHRLYVTTYLRKQIESRGLDKPLHQGRIYRIAPPKRKPANPSLETLPAINLAKESSAALVQMFYRTNAWWRDTAQRLLVERKDESVLPALKDCADSKAANPLPRLHALWTLQGMDKLDESTLSTFLRDPNSKMRAAALRISEEFLKAGGQNLRPMVFEMARDRAADVQIQLALSLGVISSDTRAREILSAMTNSSPFQLARDAAKFSLGTNGEISNVVNQNLATPTATNGVTGQPLTAEEQKLFESGKGVYEATCLACHQPHGLGQEGLAPPLVGTDWVSGPPERLIRIVLQGLRGPVKVKGQTYELDMPSLAVLEDEQIAAALTYVRHEWGHAFSAVTPSQVKKIRDDTAKREEAWTETELLKIP